MTNTKQELRERLRKTKVTAYAGGKPYNVNLATVIQTDDIDALMQIISDTVKSEVNKTLDWLTHQSEHIEYIDAVPLAAIEQVRKEYK